MNPDELTLWLPQIKRTLMVSDLATQCAEQLEKALCKLKQENDVAPETQMFALSDVAGASIDLLAALWQHYQAAAARVPDPSTDPFSGHANTLCQKLLTLCGSRMQVLERHMRPELRSTWSGLLARMIGIARWNARWSWLRYERPLPRIWTFAAYLLENAERWATSSDQCQLGKDERYLSSTDKEYLALAFVQWINPFSLSTSAYLLVEQVLTDCPGDLTFSKLTDRSDTEIIDIDTGRVVAISDVGNYQASRLRSVPLSRLRAWVWERLRQMKGNQAICVLRDAVEQIGRTAIGHQANHLVRFGNRTGVVRTAYVSFGYEQILSVWEGRSSSQLSCGHRCMVRDRSIQGCRLFIHGEELRVGMLIAVQGVFGDEQALGVVRWLTHLGSGNWDVGVWLMRGSISAMTAYVTDDKWPSGSMSHQVLIVDAEDGIHNGVIVVLPKESSREDSNEILIPEAQLKLRQHRFLESGIDFDLGLFLVEELN